MNTPFSSLLDRFAMTAGQLALLAALPIAALTLLIR
jgi:hypothetical protein